MSKKKDEIKEEIVIEEKKEEVKEEEIEKEGNVEETNVEFGVAVGEDGNVHVMPVEDGEVIETPIEEIEDYTEPEIEVISMDNKPVSNEVKEEEIIVDKRFTGTKTIKPENKAKEIKINNGRVYKEVANGYGMYADDGQIFKIK